METMFDEYVGWEEGQLTDDGEYGIQRSVDSLGYYCQYISSAMEAKVWDVSPLDLSALIVE